MRSSFLFLLIQSLSAYLKYLLYLVVGILSMAIAWVYLSREIFFDDAFMFIRYALNLENHSVFGWNSDEAAYGCTSVGYVFSTYIFIKIGLLNVVTQAKLLQIQSLFYFFLALYFCYKSTLAILDKESRYKLENSLFILLLLLLNPLLRRNITGMDTTMALFSNAFLIYACFLFYRKNTWGNLLFLILAAYLSFFVRPDNGLYATICPFLFLLIWSKNKKNLLIFSMGIGFLLFLDSLVKYIYFGAILPIPFYVKAPGFYEAYLGIDLWNTWHYLSDFILYLSPFIVASIFFFKKEQGKKIIPFLIPLILTQAYFLQTIPIMGFDSRLLVPSLPFVLAIALILGNEYDWQQKAAQGKQFFRALGAVGFLLISILGLYYGGIEVNTQKKHSATIAAAKFDLGLPLRASHDSLAWTSIVHMTNLVQEIGDENFVLGASEHGFLASNNPDTKILCLIGLHNVLSLEGKSLSKDKMELSLHTYNPDLIWMFQYNYPSLTYALMQSPYFQQNYDYYHDLLDLGVAIRKDSPYAEKIRQYLAKIYPDENIQDKIWVIP